MAVADTYVHIDIVSCFQQRMLYGNTDEVDKVLWPRLTGGPQICTEANVNVIYDSMQGHQYP